MTVPTVILAAGCVAVGIFALPVVRALLPLVAEITQWELADVRPIAEQAIGPLAAITWAAVWLIVLIGALTLLRYSFVLRRPVGVSDTWGCGYLGGTPRMQYTSSSYVQPAADFFAPLLLKRTRLNPPQGLFPQSAAVATTTADMSKEVVYRPLFGGVGWVFSRLRWLQHGRVHIYILYVGVTIVALLTWYVGAIIE